MRCSIYIFIFVLFVSSCKKKEVNNNVINNRPPAPGFTYNSNLTVLEDVTFDTVSIPENSTIMWNFGDGATSSDFTPVHIYNSRGDYHVTMTIFSPDSTYIIEKILVINVNAQRFAITKHWVFEAITGSSGNFHRTAYNEDTLVEISFVNDNTLKFGNAGSDLIYTYNPLFSNVNFIEFFPYSYPSGHTYLKLEKSTGIFYYRTLDPQSSGNTLFYFTSK